MTYPAGLPFLLAGGALLVIWFVLSLLATQFNPLKWAYGQDGRVSTSKLQLLLWMAVVLYSFLTVLAVAILRHSTDLIPNVPQNVLIALGFTGVTAITAKGITVSQLQKQSVTKVSPSAQKAQGNPGTATGLFGAVQADDGSADLGKIQMSAWTLVALGIYLYRLFQGVQSTTAGVPSLPDIDPSLMVLTGLSQGTYLGKKLVTTSTPQLFSLRPHEARPGDEVVLKGAALGASQDGSLLLLGGVAIDVEQGKWSDTASTFTVPKLDPRTNADWIDGAAVPVQVIASGRTSVGDVSLVVKTGKRAPAAPPPPAVPPPPPPQPVAAEPEKQPVTAGPNGGERTPDEHPPS